MATVAVLGERALVSGWALGGAVVVGADDDDQVCRAWRSLDADVAVVVLTPAAARALGDEAAHGVPTVVMPS